MNQDSCTHCGISWLSNNTMPEDLLAANPGYYKTLEQAKEGAKNYGWTPENDKRFSINVLGIEYLYGYDGVSEWQCLNCGARYGRWSGKLLAEGETEKMFGGEDDEP